MPAWSRFYNVSSCGICVLSLNLPMCWSSHLLPPISSALDLWKCNPNSTSRRETQPLKLRSLWFIHMCRRILSCFSVTSEKGRACTKIRQQRPGAVLSPSSEIFKKRPKKAGSKLGWLDSWPCFVQKVGLQIWGSLWHGWFCRSRGLCVITGRLKICTWRKQDVRIIANKIGKILSQLYSQWPFKWTQFYDGITESQGNNFGCQCSTYFSSPPHFW